MGIAKEAPRKQYKFTKNTSCLKENKISKRLPFTKYHNQ
jgi:hypothetical protein